MEYQIPTSRLQVPTHSQRPTPNFAPLAWAFAWKLAAVRALALGMWSLGIDTLRMTRTSTTMHPSQTQILQSHLERSRLMRRRVIGLVACACFLQAHVATAQGLSGTLIGS